MSGLFLGGGGGRAGPHRVTASTSGRPPAPEGGAPCAGWPGLTMPAPARRAGGTGLGRATSLRLDPLARDRLPSVGLESRLAETAGQISLSQFSHPLITQRFAASRKSPSRTPYVASHLLHCNDYFSHLFPSVSFIYSLTGGHLLYFRPWSHGSEGGRPGAALRELPF